MSEREWLFTFGFSHTHPVTGASLANRCVRFAGSYEEARAQMFAHFGRKWAFQYESNADTPRRPGELDPSELPPLDVKDGAAS